MGFAGLFLFELRLSGLAPRPDPGLLFLAVESFAAGSFRSPCLLFLLSGLLFAGWVPVTDSGMSSASAGFFDLFTGFVPAVFEALSVPEFAGSSFADLFVLTPGPFPAVFSG
ncbi:MAG: hypothetical protein DMF69_06205 [Acidobacteria bacterium]|nr:MAG: hypothetical protein DMF69_06205 [Acidobacteriota bacterium]